MKKIVKVERLRERRRPLNLVRHDPALRLQDYEPGPRPRRLDFDAVQWLIDERERERSGKKYGL